MLNGRSIEGKAGWTALALALCAVAAPAQADTAPITAYYRDPALGAYPYTGPDKAVILVDVTASVGGVCGFASGGAPNGTVSKTNIDTTAWTGQVPFTAQCTAPWNIAVSSQKGALESTAGISPGYANRAPYDVTLNIPYDTGTSNGTVTATCAVKDRNPATSPAAAPPKMFVALPVGRFTVIAVV